MRACLLLLVVTAGLLVGCGGKTVEIVRRPGWNYAVYERLAVVPAKARDPRASADARLLTTRLTDLLADNGAFEIVSREELADVMREQDLANLDVADPSTALPEGMIKVAQALVVATIQEYGAERSSEQTEIPIFSFRGGVPVQTGTRRVTMYRHVARVSGSVRVVDAVTGEVLAAHFTDPIEVEEKRSGRPPEQAPEDLAREATLDLAADLYVHIAPVRVEVDFDEDMFLVATGYYDGQYDELTALRPGLEQFMLVARDFERAADRNAFYVTVTEKDGRVDLYREEFVWSASAGRRGMQFTVPVELLRESGAREFTAKLYAAGVDAPIVTRDIDFANGG